VKVWGTSWEGGAGEGVGWGWDFLGMFVGMGTRRRGRMMKGSMARRKKEMVFVV